jgi:8-oxo-dGTP pyrophosphatase MutT (NUDIX family)
MNMAVSGAKVPTVPQVSAGAVAYRKSNDMIEFALIRTREDRWQLPKGIVDKGETSEETAIREVREETGIDTRLLEKLDTIEYWYFANVKGKRIRYHKLVHFYLAEYISGEVSDHDHEVIDAEWVSAEKALRKLSFKSERDVAQKAFDIVRNSDCNPKIYA